jgi:hypothetical protein
MCDVIHAEIRLYEGAGYGEVKYCALNGFDADDVEPVGLFGADDLYDFIFSKPEIEQAFWAFLEARHGQQRTPLDDLEDLAADIIHADYKDQAKVKDLKAHILALAPDAPKPDAKRHFHLGRFLDEVMGA